MGGEGCGAEAEQATDVARSARSELLDFIILGGVRVRVKARMVARERAEITRVQGHGSAPRRAWRPPPAASAPPPGASHFHARAWVIFLARGSPGGLA